MRPDDASYAEIWINSLLAFIKQIDDCIVNFIDLIALPLEATPCVLFLRPRSIGRRPAETGRETPRFGSSLP